MWKLILALILVIAVAIAGVYGYMQYQEMQEKRDIHDRLTLAQGQMEQGNHPRAQQHFEAILREYPDLPKADAVWAKLAQSYTLTEDRERALASWEKIRENYPDSDHYSKALAAMAQAAYESGNLEQAGKLWDEILTRYKGSDSIDDAQYGMALLTYRRGEVKKAKEMLVELKEQYPESNRMDDVEKLLGTINLELLYAQSDKIHRIQRGDNLDSLARKFNVSAELLARINGISDPRNLRVGRRMRIPETDFSIVVNKSDNTMTLYNEGEFFKKYPVRTGEEDWLTPTGTFRIQSKVKNPTWTDPKTGRNYPSLDPQNELGTRWMAFDGSIGFHGTIKPETIGEYASNGCVGLLKDDVEELFDLVPLGTEVKIIGKKQTEERNYDN